MDKLNMTCIVCPRGCRMTVLAEDGVFKECSGNFCARGPVYAKNELASPVRVLTSTVRTDSGEVPLLPVKTSSPIPKSALPEGMKLIKKIKAKTPVQCGEIIQKDFFGKGINLIAGRSISR